MALEAEKGIALNNLPFKLSVAVSRRWKSSLSIEQKRSSADVARRLSKTGPIVDTISWGPPPGGVVASTRAAIGQQVICGLIFMSVNSVGSNYNLARQPAGFFILNDAHHHAGITPRRCTVD
jgi:hypothetical protein